MAKYNVQTEMDDKTGNITLKLDGTFLFKRNDSKLTDKAKKTLKKIIPIYTSEIFKAKKMRDNIDHVNVIGHASPRYKRKFINPADQNTKAYNYNLDLSTNRAKEIVKFILGQKFGEFPYKSNLRDKISVIGKSYSQPIKMSPNSKSDPSCGIYNCSLSRRVEIKFTLKDDPRFYKKFDFLQKE
jgi:outer membrane protein OmpA-like peptidoglycan-associated protein